MRGHVTQKIRKSKDGKERKSKGWYVVVDIGRDENGSRKRKWFSGYPTKKLAEEALPRILQDLQMGLKLQHKETVNSVATMWAEDKERRVRQNTMRSYNWLLHSHILPALGTKDITKVSPRDIHTLYSRMLGGDAPVSNRTVQQVHVILHEIFDRALKWGMVPRNVVDAVDRPRIEHRKATIWSVEQAVEFLRVNKDEEKRCWIGFYLAIMTGMRKGEILGLRWLDVDFDSATLNVQQTLTWIGGEPLFQEPKTNKSRRAIALPDDALRELRAHRARQNEERIFLGEEYTDSGLVITRLGGAPINPRTFDDAWYRAQERTSLPKIRFHDLRHTHASLLFKQGVHPKIVSERLGHSNINITLDTYSHLLPGMQKQVADDFGNMFKEASKNISKGEG